MTSQDLNKKITEPGSLLDSLKQPFTPSSIGTSGPPEMKFSILANKHDQRRVLVGYRSKDELLSIIYRLGDEWLPIQEFEPDFEVLYFEDEERYQGMEMNKGPKDYCKAVINKFDI